MNFSKRKLPKDAAETLRVCPIESVRPYSAMPAPVYVFLKANEKFVSVKGPLDFFTPEELERLRRYESFFMPKFVDNIAQFRKAAQSVRSYLSLAALNPTSSMGSGSVVDQTVSLPPAPYEISDAVLRLIGPLWGEGAVIETFFTCVFVDELCAPLPKDSLSGARDRDVLAYEQGLLLSGTVVFLALHLGFLDISFLNMLRLEAFEWLTSGRPTNVLDTRCELGQLIQMLDEFLGDNGYREIRGALFRGRYERVCQKLHSRLQRVEQQLISEGRVAPSIYGTGGFVDV